MVLGEEAIFTTQSRDPLALSVKHKPYSLFTGICEIIRSTVLFVLQDGRKDQPAQAMLEHVESFLLESNSGESQASSLSHVTSEDSAIWGVTAPFCIT